MNNYINKDDEEQREQIITSLDKNVFVEAGAGAGKTSLIVSRLINQLKHTPKPERIVVITFTNAATEELRNRITRDIESEKNNPDLNEEEREKLQQAWEHLDEMIISTIHGFCNILLRERSFDAKLPVDLQIIEEDEQKKLENEFFSNWFAGLEKDKLDELCDYEEMYRVESKVRELYQEILAAGEQIEVVIPYVAPYTSANVIEDMNKWIDSFEKEFQSWEQKAKDILQTDEVYFQDKEGGVRAADLNQAFQDYHGFTAEQKKDKERLQAKIKELEEWKPVKSKPYFNKGKAKDNTKEPMEGLVDTMAAWWKDNRFMSDDKKKAREKKLKEAISVKYLECANEACQAYRAQRKPGMLTFDQILYVTGKLLEDSAEARAYFAEKYDYFYVDEFQDTDRIQTDFIWKLASKLGKDELREGALFLVGDPKQSIYRFRGAEPEVYFEIKQRMENMDNAEVFSLKNNYRSNSDIVKWVNQQFQDKPIVAQSEYSEMNSIHVVPEEIEQEKYGQSSTNDSSGEGNKEAEKKVLSGVYRMWNPKEVGSVSMEEDAVATARLIRRLVEGKYQIPYWDQGEASKRDIQYRDFLILSDTHKDMGVYIKALQEEGIRTEIMGEFYANEEQMVRIFLRLYRALINYRDRAAKQGALETLRYGGIFKIKSKDEAESYLFSLRQETKEMSAYGKAQYLVKYLEMLMLESSEKTDANLKLESAQTRLQQMLENVVQDGFCDDGQLAENFATYIEKQLDRELSLHQEQDAVRFMNLHKAKGLEGNIVIWTMRNKSREFNKGAYRKDGKYYPSLKSRYGRWCSYEKNTTIYEEAKGETEREEIRLEYVMATRAKQVLIFMDNMNKHSMFSDRETVDKKEVTYNLQNLPSLEKMSDKTLNETAAQQQSNDNANDSDATEKMTIYRFDRSEASLKNIAYVSYRPSDFEHGRKRKSNTKAVKWKRPKGTEFGTTMHRSLELLLNRMMHLEECNREQQLDKMVTACVHQAMNEEKNDIASAEVEDYKAILPEMLKAYWSWLSQTDYLKGVKAIHTELPFSYLKTIEDIKSENAEYLREKLKKDELEEVPVWVNGTADLLFLYEDGTALVLDYKSDTIGGLELEQFREDLKKAYGGQLDMYRYAIQKLYDIPLDKITTKLVYFYEKDQQIIVEDVEKEHN